VADNERHFIVDKLLRYLHTNTGGTLIVRCFNDKADILTS
jgi:hypothetical protein